MSASAGVFVAPAETRRSAAWRVFISQRATRHHDPTTPVQRKRAGKPLWAVVRVAFASDRSVGDALGRAEQAIDQRARREGATVSTMGSHLLVQVHEGRAGDPALPALRSLGEAILAAIRSQAGERPWIGIGSAQRQRESVNAGMRQARQAIELARALWETPRAILYEDVLPFAAIQSDPVLCERLSQLLDPIASLDRRHGTAMMETLLACVDENWSKAAAARRLAIHRHTIEYRLQQVRRVLGYDVRRSPDRFVLETATIARRLRARG